MTPAVIFSLNTIVVSGPTSGDSIQGSIFLHQLQVVVEDPHVRRMLLNSKSEIVMGVFLSQRDDLTILIFFGQSEKESKSFTPLVSNTLDL